MSEETITPASIEPLTPAQPGSASTDNLISEDKDLTASDLQKAAGMSYRQLNSWDEKGAIPESRDNHDAWRKFSPNDFFTILICKELRDRFGVSFEAIRRLQERFEKDNFNNFQHTVKCISPLGYAVCLFTDLEQEFCIDQDLGIANYIRAGLLRKKNSKDYIILRLNPLVNKIFELLQMPPLPDGDAWYEKLFELQGQAVVKNDAEFHLLSLVRSKDFRHITVHLKDGRIYQTDTYEELAEKIDGSNELMKIIKEKQYQSVSIDLADGEVIRISRKSPVKFNKTTEKS
ncbi:MAG: MerR family transcriptional regulator [Candidatus Omnitrophota bacterium]